LKILEDEIKARNEIAMRYSSALSGNVQVPVVAQGNYSAWAQYTIRVPAQKRPTIMAALKEQGIPTMIYYPKPLHRQTAYRDFPVAGNGLPVSERLADEVLSLPMHPYLDHASQNRIVETLISIQKAHQ